MSASVGARLTAGWLSAVFGTLAFAQAPPPADPDAKLAQLAIETARAGTIAPIPLDTSPGPPHGAIYDRFMLGVVAAKAALAAGRTPFAGSAGASPAFVPQTMVVVAYPRQCEGRVSPAQSVRLSARAFRPAASEGETPTSSMYPVREVATGAAAKALLPGVTLPPASLVVGFASTPLTDATITIAYTEPLCPATLKTVDLTVHTVPARPVKTMTNAPMPSDHPNLASPAPVQMQVVIDRDGRLKLPSLLQGPPALESPAIAILKQWQFEPARANDVAIVQVTEVPITFVAADRPTVTPTPAVPATTQPVTASGTAAAPEAPAVAPVVLTTSNDEPGLTSATSKCPVSDDATYAFSAANAIRIGGGAEAVSRAGRYMAALRGPGGLGLKYRRTGAMLAPDQKTIVDVFEVSYFGVVQPVRLYFDRTRADVLKAPAAWACNQEINKR